MKLNGEDALVEMKSVNYLQAVHMQLQGKLSLIKDGASTTSQKYFPWKDFECTLKTIIVDMWDGYELVIGLHWAAEMLKQATSICITQDTNILHLYIFKTNTPLTNHILQPLNNQFAFVKLLLKFTHFYNKKESIIVINISFYICTSICSLLTYLSFVWHSD